MTTTVLTVGHGTRSHGELGDLLRTAGAAVLTDVRRYPASRRNPHLAAEPLGRALTDAGLGYEWWGEDLGGRRRTGPGSRHGALTNDAFRGYADHMDTPAFRDALEALATRAKERMTAVMCAETLWWRCHRRLIADALVLRGFDVMHLLGPGASQPHRLHPAVRCGSDGWPVYDVGVTAPFPAGADTAGE